MGFLLLRSGLAGALRRQGSLAAEWLGGGLPCARWPAVRYAGLVFGWDGVTGVDDPGGRAVAPGNGNPYGECGHQGPGDGLPGPHVGDVEEHERHDRDGKADPG